MRISQVLVAITVAILATNADIVTATGAATDTKVMASTTTDGTDVPVQKIPFKYGNITGIIVITIDPDSLQELSDDELASAGQLKVYDFTRSDESGSGGEERWLGSRAFLDKLLMYFNFDTLAFLLRKMHRPS